MIGKIANLLYNVFCTLRICWADFIFYIKYAPNITTNTKDKKYVNVMLAVHALEKGMSFLRKKNNWGREKVLFLCDSIPRLYETYGDDFRLQLAMSVLLKYKEDANACHEILVVNRIDSVIDKYYHGSVTDSGVKPIIQPQFSATQDQIREFFSSRFSLRYYSDQEVTEDEISNALNLARTTPTACNRQTSRVYVFKDKKQIRQILDNQLGDQGWCMNANVLFVITSNGSCFNSIYESKEVYIDGGLYAMNFCLGLHMQKIGSCFKMFIRTPSKEKEFRNICNIPPQEIPIVLLLAGHYPENNKFKTPASIRIS